METYNIIKKLIDLMAFESSEVKCDEETRKISVFINDPVTPFLKKNLGFYVQNFSLIAHLIAKKQNEQVYFVDINNYRAERERIIGELAKAAAKKVTVTKQPIPLPPMNAYERRLVHTTLAVHPEVKTESTGTGKDRHIIITLV